MALSQSSPPSQSIKCFTHLCHLPYLLASSLAVLAKRSLAESWCWQHLLATHCHLAAPGRRSVGKRSLRVWCIHSSTSAHHVSVDLKCHICFALHYPHNYWTLMMGDNRVSGQHSSCSIPSLASPPVETTSTLPPPTSSMLTSNVPPPKSSTMIVWSSWTSTP